MCSLFLVAVIGSRQTVGQPNNLSLSLFEFILLARICRAPAKSLPFFAHKSAMMWSSTNASNSENEMKKMQVRDLQRDCKRIAQCSEQRRNNSNKPMHSISEYKAPSCLLLSLLLSFSHEL